MISFFNTGAVLAGSATNRTTESILRAPGSKQLHVAVKDARSRPYSRELL